MWEREGEEAMEYDKILELVILIPSSLYKERSDRATTHSLGVS
jgi:hypothetical protein